MTEHPPADGADPANEPAGPIAEPTEEDLRSLRQSQLSPRRIAINLIGFAIGAAILVSVIMKAAKEGDWERVLNAPPLLLIGLVGATAGSAVLNAMMFWVTGRPLRHLHLRDMLCLNVVANMLNYAPMRIGALSRFAYHMRVDRLGLITIGAWFALIFYLLVVGVSTCAMATLIRPTIDVWWVALAAGLTIIAGVVTRLTAGLPLAARFGRGLERILIEPIPLWGGLIIRMLDLGMYAGRMAAALAILGITIPAGDAILLALVAFVSSLSPIGRVGVREFIVAFVAARLGSSVAEGVSWEQLALVESAGEAIFYVPLGIVGLVWLRKKWMRAGAPTVGG